MPAEGGEKLVQRFDRCEIQATKTPEGFIQDSPIIGRVGILEYYRPDGSVRREFRPADEAFADESLASLKGKPVTVGHPGVVNAVNIKDVAPIGTVLTGGRQDGDYIRADMVIYNLDTAGRELSCGYALDLDETPGEWLGQKYDAIQRNIRYNHVAVVPKGRAGPMAKLNMDGSQEYEEEESNTMPKIRLDNGLEYDASQEVIVAFEKLRADHATAIATQKDLQTRLDTTEAAKDALQVKVDGHATELDKVRKDADNALKDAVKARVALIKTADEFKVDKADEMTDRQLKEAVIKAARGDSALDLSQKSDAYIEAAFDLAMEDGAQRTDSMSQQRQTVNHRKPDDQRRADSGTSADARQRMIDSLQTAYQPKEEK